MTETEVIGTELIPIEAKFVDVIVDEEKEIFNYIRPHEAKMLIEATGTTRNHLLFNIFWQTGARESEILKLRPLDIVDAGIQMVTLKQRNEVKQRTKTGTWKLRDTPRTVKKTVRRTIPIKSELRAEIHKFSFDSRMNPDDLFFPITPRRVQQILDDITTKTNITYKKIHPHLFRHGFAVNFINQGGALHKLKYLLGHNHIQTTMMYLQLVDTDLKRDIERTVF